MVGVGQHIKIALTNLGIQTVADERGCKCDRLARLMDAMGPDACEKDIDRLVDLMQKSIYRWRRSKGKVIGAVMRPPDLIVREFITWAIEQARRDERMARQAADPRHPRAKRISVP